MTLDLERIKQRTAAASPPPWSWQRSRDFPGELVCLRATTGAVVAGWSDVGGAEGVSVGEADKAFLEHARADIPALMAEVERLRDALEVIETSVVDGRASLDVWDLMDIATKALRG